MCVCVCVCVCIYMGLSALTRLIYFSGNTYMGVLVRGHVCVCAWAFV
jgi:hypothetical protein